MLQRYLSLPPVVSLYLVHSTEIMSAPPGNDYVRCIEGIEGDGEGEGAAGYNLHAQFRSPSSASRPEVVIPPGERALISTGCVFMLPPGTYGRVAPKSGSPLAFGVDVVGGLITSDYRGEVNVIISNSSDQPFTVRQGDLVAQVIVEKFNSLDAVRLWSIGDYSNNGR